MGKVKEAIFKIAKRLAEEDVKRDNPYIGGWEDVEAAVGLKLKIEPLPYVVGAMLEYLDEKVEESDII